MTPAEMKAYGRIAARILGYCSFMGCTPAQYATQCEKNAATMRGYAVKAAASKTGKYRGYTESDALASVARHETNLAVCLTLGAGQ